MSIAFNSVLQYITVDTSSLKYDKIQCSLCAISGSQKVNGVY